MEKKILSCNFHSEMLINPFYIIYDGEYIFVHVNIVHLIYVFIMIVELLNCKIKNYMY